jgi:predicted GIY-YIG superfamily endonuclease
MGDANYIVYLHISKITGEIYVGYTKNGNSPNKRWKNGYGYTNCKKFYNYIKRYGWDSFYHIVLCYTSKKRALCIEHQLTKIYKHKNISLNILDGGQEGPSGMLGKHHTLEAKQKIAKASKGRKMT